MKLIPIQIALAAAVALSGAASAQTAAAPVSPWSFNIAVTSNYKFRGQDQDTSRGSQFKPALQGGIDYAFASGFYLGNWNSMVNFVDPDPANVTGKRVNLEMDFYGGYKWAIGDWGFDIGLLQYYYPSATKANTTEAYIGASYGPFSAKYSNTLSKGYFGTGIGTVATPTSDGRGTQYFNIGFAKEVAPSWTLKASVGQTTFKNAVKAAGIPNFTDYSVGVSYDFGNALSLAGYVQGASQKNAYLMPAPNATKSLNRDTFILTLTKAF
ncbi:MAG: TorF family putative porin [Pseudomonadota bacterium]